MAPGTSVKPLCRILLMAAAACFCAPAQSASPAAAAGPSATPFARGEALNYAINWPSGLSLGEAQFKAGGGEPGWEFELTLDAGLPGFDIKERYKSASGAAFCSQSLEKDTTRGSRKGREKITFDQQKHVATRQTPGGGKSEVSIPDCAKDGLAFFYFLRRELAQGRIPGSQAVNLGAAYQVTATYADSLQIEVGGARQVSDRVQVSIRGPASSHTFEIFFGRDAARTPLLVRVPFSMGTFVLELVR